MRKGQAAIEYLTTYGWAIMAALIGIGVLSYFGLMNPSSMLPNKCDFGRQLECVDYKITSDGAVNIIFRNNFGKDIEITDVNGIDALILGDHPFDSPISIPSSGKAEIALTLDTAYRMSKNEKQEVRLAITFKRTGAGFASHNLTGSIFTGVQ